MLGQKDYQINFSISEINHNEINGLGWYARQDSNLRPLVPETNALSN